MSHLHCSRRAFPLGAGAAVAAGPLRMFAQTSDIRFGDAAITWGGEDVKAIEDVGAAGFRRVQLRASAVNRFHDRPEALKELLARHHLTFPVQKYASRITVLHIKDLESPVPGATGDLSRSYRFVELGPGKVALKGVFTAVKQVGFSGWAIVELDRVPDPSRTPKESAFISREYLQRQLRLTI